MITATADVALFVDADGIIRDLAVSDGELLSEIGGAGMWLGKPWVRTVTVESRPKIEALLRDAGMKATSGWRHVNYPSPEGPDVPVLYSAIQLGDEGRVVAFGRDLRSLSEMQRRLVNAQQSLERDYARLRQVETRYRILFDTSSDAVLILDSATHKVTEANPPARQMLGEAARRIVGRAFPDLFDAAGRAAVETLLAAIEVAGRADDARVRLASGQHEVLVSASLFRQDEASLFLVRLFPLQEGAAGTVSSLRSQLLRLVERSPDGFVVTDADGHILTANASFLEMAQLVSEEQARGESLERWLGRPGVDLGVLTANLRQRGSLRLFATTLRGEHGTSTEVEISAVAMTGGGQSGFGFAIRDVARRLAAEPRTGRELPRSVEQITELIGRVPLKDLVREATDVIEKLCIEAALELTGDNRASAAEMLGLSRQSLYVKLRRYGLGDLAEEDAT